MRRTRRWGTCLKPRASRIRTVVPTEFSRSADRTADDQQAYPGAGHSVCIRDYLSLVSGWYEQLHEQLSPPREIGHDNSPLEVSDSKVIHWTANPEEFEAVKQACGKCTDEQSCRFHRAAERRVGGGDD